MGVKILSDDELNNLNKCLADMENDAKDVRLADLTQEQLDELIGGMIFFCKELGKYARAYKELADKAKGL